MSLTESLHPFARCYGDQVSYICDADSRIQAVRNCAEVADIEGLELILNESVGAPLQANVRKRAESALRRLRKEANRG